MVDDERLAALRARMVQLTAERERCRARATQYRQEAQSIARRLAAQPSASATGAQRTTEADRPRATYHEREFEVAGGAKQLLLRVFEPDLHGEKTLMIRVTGLDQDGGPEIREMVLPQRLWPFVQRFCDVAQCIGNEDGTTSRTPSPATSTTCRLSEEAMPAQRSSGCSGTGVTAWQHSSIAPRGESAAAASPPLRHQTSARRSLEKGKISKHQHTSPQQVHGHPPQGNVPQPTVKGTAANNTADAKGQQRVLSRQQKTSGVPVAPQQQTSERTGRRRGGSANGSVVISVRGGDVKISLAEGL